MYLDKTPLKEIDNYLILYQRKCYRWKSSLSLLFYIYFWRLKFFLSTSSNHYLLSNTYYRPVSQVSCSALSDSLWPHGLQHTRLLCLSLTPKAYSNSSSSSQWCHPIILSSFIPFSSCLQSFPASGSFQMTQFFTSGGKRVGASALASVLPVNIWDWFRLGSPCRLDLLAVSSLALSFPYGPTLTSIHGYWENHSFD